MSNQPNVSIVLSRLSDLAKSNNRWPDMWMDQLDIFDISFLHKCNNYQMKLL